MEKQEIGVMVQFLAQGEGQVDQSCPGALSAPGKGGGSLLLVLREEDLSWVGIYTLFALL